MSNTFYPGRRLSYDGFLCTVRYVGPLAGTAGEWLGVEWDDITRGKHNGQHKGQQIFQCLSSASTAASFVKTSRKIDAEQTVVEAIKAKYGSADAPDLDVVIISGKVAEEIGFDKIAQEQARLADLRIVLIDQMVVNGVAARSASHSKVRDAQEELRATCPNITELDLGWNTFESWTDVALVCTALPKLKVLKIGGSRFRSFAVDITSEAFFDLTQLSLEGCLIQPGQLSDLLHGDHRFGNLQQLQLSDNDLVEILPTADAALPSLQKLTSIDLRNNKFRDLSCVRSLTVAFPHLQSISLQANLIESIGSFPKDAGAFFQIQSMNLSRNRIPSFAFIDRLPKHFPGLKSLHITQNPFFTPDLAAAIEDAKVSDKKYYLTLARLASLQVLNHAKISARDREEGEIYYLSVADEQIKKQIGSAESRQDAVRQVRNLFPRYEELAEKYNHESLAEQYLSSKDGNAAERAQAAAKIEYPAGSLGARIVTATFYLTGKDTAASTSLRLPSTVPVTQVMALLMQHPTFRGSLGPLRFKLIFESKELDPIDTTTESTTRSATYGRGMTLEQRKALWQEWGDWDADAIVDNLSQENAADVEPNGQRSLNAYGKGEHWIEDGKICLKAGRRFKFREIEIPPALKRPWGDWLEGSKEVRIRIEPYERNL